MHRISESIERDNKYLVLCPNCEFGFDLVEMVDIYASGQALDDFVSSWMRRSINTEQVRRQ